MAKHSIVSTSPSTSNTDPIETEKIFETGTQKIFSQLAQNALTAFEVDPRRLHFDNTSVSVFGDYDLADGPFDTTL